MAMKINIQLSKQQQQMVAAGAVFSIAFGYIYFAYYWKPLSHRIDEAKQKIESVNSDITKAESQAARLPRLEKELAMLNQQTAEAEKRLPKSRDVPAVIDTLSRLAHTYRAELTSFAPGNPSPKQFFTEVPYTINATGTYHDIGIFLAAIALEERIFNVRDITYSLSAGKGLSINFILVSYQYKG